jgi:hypothetical protein
MKMLFFRRQHQKLDEMSHELKQSDVSTGSDSINSIDHTSTFTNNVDLHSPIEADLYAEPLVEYPSRFVPYESKPRRFWRLGWASNRAENLAKRRRNAIEELDKTVLQIRRNKKIAASLPTHPVESKVGDGTWIKDDKFNVTVSTDVLPREVTWRRRVSSLEAFFQRECKSKYSNYRENSLESALKKVIPFESSIGKSESSLGLNDDESRDTRQKHSRPKYTRRKSTFEETVEQGVSEIIDKITSRGEEILESVPDWSVASSSVDFMSAATSDDDETSVSGYRQINSWSPTLQSNSSVDDDEYFTADAGCNSVESCSMMTKEIGTFLEEMMPRESSVLSCLVINERKSRRRKKKRL